MNIFLAPHSDDEALFGSYIIQRTKPLVIIATNGTTHTKFGVTAKDRRNETLAAMKILGVKVEFLNIDEDKLTQPALNQKLWEVNEQYELDEIEHVFAPAKQGGHAHHDLLSECAKDVFSSLLYYATYSKESLFLTGEMPLYPTKEEYVMKEKALACYVSQLKINKHHFDAVHEVPEYLSFSNETIQ